MIPKPPTQRSSGSPPVHANDKIPGGKQSYDKPGGGLRKARVTSRLLQYRFHAM